MKSRNNLTRLLHQPASLSEKFHKKTKIKTSYSFAGQTYSPESWKTVVFKAYPRLNEVILPKPRFSSLLSLKEALQRRKSSRIFAKKPLSLEKLSTLLFYSAGLRDDNPPYLSRFYPSAGARFPLEIYILPLNTDLSRGLYHYYVKNHSLEELLTFSEFDFYKYFIKQTWIPKVACIILVTAIFKRNTVKYGDRGYRHVLVEAGHLAQNFYLTGAALNLSCCAIGGYFEEELEKLLDIDGIEESVVYALALGNT